VRAALFDSGVGGLTVAKSLIDATLFDEIIYFGDTARVPYGTKDANTVLRYSLEALEFFKNFDVDVMLVACNTASAYALEELKKQAPFPVYGVIEPGVLAVEKALLDKHDEILVIGTSATIASRMYQTSLLNDGYTHVTAIPTPLFVPLVEEELFKQSILEPIFEHYFGTIGKPKAIILGCTHFPLLERELLDYFGEDTVLIHSGDAIVEYLKEQKLPLSDAAKKACKLQLFSSDNIDNLKKVASQWIYKKG
jgi:glutamate racemase